MLCWTRNAQKVRIVLSSMRAGRHTPVIRRRSLIIAIWFLVRCRRRAAASNCSSAFANAEGLHSSGEPAICLLCATPRSCCLRRAALLWFAAIVGQVSLSPLAELPHVGARQLAGIRAKSIIGSRSPVAIACSICS